jgi:hypothetical protein
MRVPAVILKSWVGYPFYTSNFKNRNFLKGNIKNLTNSFRKNVPLTKQIVISAYNYVPDTFVDSL